MFKKRKKSLGLNDPVYSAREIILIWQYLLKHGTGIEKFFEGIEIPREKLLSRSQWLDVRTFSRIIKNYRACIPDYDMTKAFDLAFNQFGSYAYGLVSAAFRLPPIGYIVKAIPYFVSMTSKVDLFRVLEMNTQSAILEYKIYPGFESFIDSAQIYTWLGVFTAIPTIQDLPPAKVSVVSSFIDVFKKFRQDFAQFNHQIEEDDGIIYFDGEKAGKWITITKDAGLDPAVQRYLANEKCILWEKDVVESKPSGETIIIANKGDLYNCSKTIIRSEWENINILPRIGNFLLFLKQYVPSSIETRDTLSQQADILYEYSKLLEQQVREKTNEVLKAQAEITELEKRSMEHQITGGFAHEMRNALTGAQLEIKAATHYRNRDSTVTDSLKESCSTLIKNFSQLVEKSSRTKEKAISNSVRELEQINEIADHLSDIISGVSSDIDRGLAITAQIYDYSRLHEITPGKTPVDLVQLLNKKREEYSKDFTEHGISCSINGEDKLVFESNEIHMNSIFSNLILNARDALVDTKINNPKIHIEISHVNDNNIVKIQDNGSGISQAILNNIFEPFFSTKPTKGVGLGLGVAKRLVALYDGRIEVESELKLGTLVRVILPG